MTPSHSPFVRKLPCGTVPHGIAHIRSSLGHLTLHRHSAWAVAAEVSTQSATSRPADRTALTLRAEDLPHAAPRDFALSATRERLRNPGRRRNDEEVIDGCHVWPKSPGLGTDDPHHPFAKLGRRNLA